MRLKIIQTGDPVLRQVARPLLPAEIQSAEIQRLIQDMRETMHDAPGVGLAAPQVGLPLAVVEDRQEILRDLPPQQLAERERRPVPFQVVINPAIRAYSEEAVDFFEGCLSVDGFMALVPRARGITVESLDEQAKTRVIEARGWYARILQHEIDHLNGVVYIDRMRARSFTCVDNFNRHWKEPSISGVMTSLGIKN
jgi:peptide deformylase